MWTEPIWILIALAVLVPAQGNPPVITNFPKEDLVKPEDVKFKSDLGFTLPCNATGSNLTWTWKHNGTAITESSHFDLSEDGTLTGKVLSAIHSGTYQCFVKDEVTGAVAFSRKLKVAVTVVGTFIDRKDHVVKVNLGESFYYDCPPHSYSYGVVYSWGNIRVDAPYAFGRNERRSILSNGTLYITYLTQKDIDEIESYDGIRCTISGANSFQRSGTLRLEKINENQTDSENSTSPSWLLTPNEKESAVEGKSKILYCFSNGRPTPKITWKKDGREITDGQNSFSISSSFHGRRLSIESVDETNHQGVYTCEAENAMNTGNPITFKTTLTIEVPPKWAANPPPNDITIVIEKNGTLECQVTANPAAITTWYKNGEVLQPSGRLVLADNKLHLTDVNLDDTGVYQCEATNAHGTIISSTWVYVSAWKPSFENVQFGPFHLLNEIEARLPCKPSTGAPQPSYRWFKDGELITYEENSRYKLDMDGTLVIKEVDKDQDGVNYTCKASNLMGEDSITTVPIILVPPMLTTEPSNQTVLEGTTVTFQCSATGNPTPNITWTKNGKGVGSGNILRFQTNRNQSGKYWCSAENGLNITANGSAFLNVLYKPSLTTLPSNQIVLEGNTATFHCEATGNPAPKITWMKDGKTVSEEQPLNIETHRNDSGKYWCLAENGLNSTVNASAMLDVQFPPSLTTVPVNQTIMEGKTVTFHCTATGNPAPTITWTKDGEDVESGEVLSLETSRNQSGEYVCTAENGLNFNANASAVLDVLYKPSLTTLPSDRTVLEGNTAKFHCAAAGNPAPKITWMKDGKTVSQEQTLNIETHRNDSGKYWCLTENGLNSTVNASAMLDVQFPPSLKTTPINQTVMEGASATFYCTATGNPAPEITWTIDGMKVGSGDTLSFETNRNQTGKYWCSVENGLDVVNASADLDVLYKPSLITNPTNQTVLEGTSATFRCVADGNPIPQITWKKDGKTVSQGDTLNFETNRAQSGEYFCLAENGLNSTASASAHLDVQFPPSLVTTPVNQTIMEGTTATFHCTATGNPVPKITWTMNGKRVGSGKTLSFETNRNQSGKYWCSANNGLDVIVNASAYLDVLYKPSLTTPPTNQTALEGTSATFRCKADGNPTPRITWEKDGKTVAEGDVLSFETNKTQSGKYLCSADNGLNSTVSASAHLNVQFPPSLVTTPVNQTIMEGTTATFHCTATGNPVPKITWTMNGKTVGSGKTLSFETNRNQSGKYWCSAKNGLDVIVNASANLDVLYKPSLTTTPTNHTALEGTSATFRCMADGNPTPKITWKKDGKTVAEGDVLSFETNRTQSGKYLCSADNGLNSTASASAHLNVQFPPSLVTTPVNQTIMEGTTATFHCTVTGNPVPKITWTMNGKTVGSGETLSFETNRNQSGKYWCSANNGLDVIANASANLDVLYRPSLTTTPTNHTALEGTLATFLCVADGNPTPTITWKKDGKTLTHGDTLSFETNRTQSGEYVCSAENGLNSTVSASAHLNVQYTTSLITKPSDTVVMENQEVNLQCSAIGNPTPKITWIKDGEEVDRGNKLSFKALRSQSGRYWCLAQNGLEDSVNASAYLDVQFPPSLITTPLDQRVIEGSKATFNCNATGNPTPQITWKKDGEVVAEGESLSFETSKNHSGKYLCIAENGLNSTASASASLDVQFAPSLITTPTDQTVMEGAEAIFFCNATGNPIPKITWMKDGEIVGQGDTLSFETSRNQSGKYLCSAENGLNSTVNSTANLDVQFPPRFSTKPSDKTAMESEQVTFHCTATGNPTPTITWLKDGNRLAEGETLSLTANRTHSGKYWCLADNNLDIKVNTSASLDVQFTPSLITTPEDHTVMESETVTFYCNATGNPTPRITWIRDGKTIADGNILSLETNRNQSGEYWCSAENGLNSTVNASANLDVQFPPTLKIKPQDQSIVENKEVTFHCTATGNPPPTITWIENGKTVAQGDSWSFIAKRNHSGKYWCSATNGLDKTTNSSAYLNVQFAPSLISTPADQTVLESETATFYCNATGNPAPKISWIKDGKTVAHGETLTFKTNRTQSGKYWCSAENGLNSTVNASASLDVLFQPSFTTEPSNQTIVENEEVTLHCMATGNPIPEITWIKDGKTVAQGDKLSFKANRSHSGEYWCKAGNGLDISINASAYLDVQFVPGLITEPVNQTVTESENVTFHCNAIGNPTPKISWMKDGKTVAKGKTLSFESNRNQSGKYWCLAENGLNSTVNASATLDVQFPPSFTTKPSNESVVENKVVAFYCAAIGNPVPKITWMKDGEIVSQGESLSFGAIRSKAGKYWCSVSNGLGVAVNTSAHLDVQFAPSLITKPTNQTVIESKTVTFNCSATGNPTPKITWLKDGTTVGHGETLSFEATRNQSGKYWCTAENGLSVIVNASAILDVQFPPSIITRPSDQTIIEKERITFHCTATGNPTPKVTWLKDGETVAKGETLSFEANRNQSGNYWCSVENGLGITVNASAHLNVQYPPSLTTKPSDQVVLEGTEITFHCAADGNPVPEIKWMKDGKTVATQGLLIFEAMRNQSGKYWCSVENGLNSTVNASAALDVQYLPNFVNKPVNQTVKETDMVMFHCNATGNPLPNVTWYKDGKTVAHGETLRFESNRNNSGNYWCMAENGLKTVMNTSAYLDVLFAPSLTTAPSNQTVLESDEATFQCIATGNPTPKITWTKDGMTVGSGEILRFSASRNQSGKYWCSAENGFKATVNASAYLDVHFAPSLTGEKVNKTVNESDEVTLHCDAIGNPAPKITWMKDGKPVAYGDTLRFTALRNDSGIYLCLADNGLNVTVKARTRLNVQYPPSFSIKPSDKTVVEANDVTFTCNATGNPTPKIVWIKDGTTVSHGETLSLTPNKGESGEYWCSAENGLGPAINTSAYLDVQFPANLTTTPVNQTVLEGETATLDCAASGNPTPNISWIKDGITVGKGDHLSLVVNRNQSGNYWCVAENGFQTIANASAYLNVLFAPSITVRPTNQTVEEGGLATFNCSAIGNPVPNIAWINNGKTVTQGNTLSVDANRNHSGRYWCLADNGLNPTVNASANLDVQFSPSITIKPTDKTITEGDMVAFRCTASGNPIPEIKWIKDGKTLAEGDTLSLKTNRTQSGKYWCSAQNGVKSAVNASANLDVQFPPSFTKRPSNQTVVEGTNVTFLCTATGNPTPTVTWMKDGSSVAEGETLGFETSRNDSGKYWCLAKNGLGEAINTTVYLDVKFSPSIISQPKDKTVIEGDMATFQCTATGNPAPNITWMKDGKTVAEGDTLSFKPNRTQSGKYWCLADNGLKSPVNTSANLDVQFPPSFTWKPANQTVMEGTKAAFHCNATGNPTPKISWMKDGNAVAKGNSLSLETNRNNSGNYWCLAENGVGETINTTTYLDVQFSPSIVVNPTNKTVAEGNEVAFHCTATGNPTPTITWIKDGKTVDEGDTLSFEANRTQSGKYWCLADNGLKFTDNASANLDVLYQPSFTSRPSNQTVIEGTNVTFLCTATGNPTPTIKWMKNGTSMSKKDTLTFETSRNDSGKYWCLAKNGLGDAINTTVYLDVQYPSSIIIKPTDKIITEGNFVTFSCVATGNPTPKITWTKDGKTVGEGDTLSFETNRTQSGEYWCSAENGVKAVVNASANLDVQFPPSFDSRPANQTVIEGTNATFHCTATGNPTPTITWMKDGKSVAEGHTLSFETSRNDSGKYWCLATNGLGETINTTVNLDVQYSPSIILKPEDKIVSEGKLLTFQCAAAGNPSPKITWTKDGITMAEGDTLSFRTNRTQSGKYWCSAENGVKSAVNASANLDVQFPPSFDSRPTNQTVIEGTNTTFHCTAIGNPTPTITWMKDGKSVAEGHTFSFETSRNDSGKYWCLATNGLGETINTTVHLDVQYPPSIILKPSDKIVAEGNMVTFQCAATGNPTPKMTWTIDGKTVAEGDTLSFRTNRTQSGKYWCSAENGLKSSVNASANLDVQFPPSFTSRPSNQTVIEGTNVSFLCTATGNPAPTVTWMKDGSSVAEGHTLSIETSRNDSGKYWCLAENGLGEAINTTVYLNVQFSPSIIIKPTNKTVAEGDMVAFHCAATGNPTPKMIWINNGKTVGEGDTLSFETNRTQTGKYWCLAENGLASAVNASANLDVQFPPNFTSRPSNQTVIEGTKIIFNCSATGNPHPDMSWLKDGKTVAEGDTLSLETSRNDSGIYWCLAKNGVGEVINATAYLDVQFSPSIITKPTNKTAIEGDMVSFRCKATGNPTPMISWIKDGKTVAEGDTLSFKTNKTQSGEYWCTAANGMKATVNASANLDVQFPPSFTSRPTNQTVIEGTNTTFHCAATGNPTPKMSWLKDGETVAEGDTLSLQTNRSDSGKYWCFADNGLGDAIETTAHLDVQFPPALTVTPTNLTMAEGHNATLRCSAAGNPTPTITWMKDGQTVATGRSLTLEVKKEDSGIYWCIADNGLRVTANASAFLNVQFSSGFTTLPSDQTVMEGEEVIFHCAAKGNPMPRITWTKDGNILASGNTFKFTARKNDSGEYFCSAENGVELAINASAHLDVQYAPSFVVKPTNKTITEGSSVVFTCDATGNPIPEITWFKDGETVAKGKELMFVTNRNQSGEYWCLAANGLNVTVNASASLDVQFPPSFTATPSDLTVREDSEARFHCSASGNPTPEITWMKDGKTVAQGGVLRFSAKRNQSGEYQCSADNGMGVNITASASLDVQFEPSLITAADNQTVIEGTKVTFYCNASGNPSPKITWSKDGKILTEGETLSFEANRNQFGEYWCSAKNGLSVTANASAHLDVQFLPSFTSTPSNLTVREDSEAIFLCTATGNPTPTISWMKDGKTVGQGDELRFSAKRNQSGEYRCSADNGLGVNITASASLDVQFEPRLITTPDDQTVIEGTKATFHCNASGNPSPKITWSKDGKTLTEGETLSFEANRNQSGEYWCSAENGLSVTVNASAHLDVQFLPSFTSTPSDLTVREDSEAIFLCTATGNPTPTIKWMKDGKIVGQGDELRFSAKRNQSGEYRCSADNGLGLNITAIASLDVQFEPRLITTPDDQTVIEGTKATFHCNASGNPSPKITWSKDGKTLTEGETLSFEANRNQSGEYWCSAENGLSVTVNASAHLDVQFLPSFTSTPSDLTVREDSEAIFLCTATGNPNPTITWMKDGKIVGQGDELRFSAKRNQSGEYRCSGDNGLGVNITAIASLDVQFEPRLITTPDDQTVIEGTKATFYCNASGNPSPKITWSKDGKTLTEGETLSFEANRNQSGEYWCSVENGLSVTVNASAHLDVQFLPSFTSKPSDVTVREGSEAIFLCTATGNPTPTITWMKDGKTVGLGDELRFSAKRNQSGEYRCSADNGLSVNITASASLDVQFEPSLITTPDDQIVIEGTKVTFLCNASGNPSPKITWSKDGKTLTEGETLSFEANRNQSGEYWCSAENGLSVTVNASAHLDVQFLPRFTSTPSNLTVREDSEAIFLCTATGNPTPTITWMKDGKTVAQGDELRFIAKRNQSGEYRCSADNGLGVNITASASIDVQFEPSLITTPDDQTVIAGTKATFHCNASGNPSPTITWSKDGKTLTEGETLSFEANRNQSGEYWCSAENGLSVTVNDSAHLDVQFPPSFTTTPSNLTVQEDNEARFHCSATGNPPPTITWMKDGKTVVQGDELRFTAKRNQSGEYLCSADNGLGVNITASASLDVQFAPSLISTPADQTVIEGTKTSFFCNASGNPSPKITWSKDGEILTEGETLSFEANRNQSGEYWCSAENGLRVVVNASAHLDVQYALSFTSIPGDQTIEEGDEATFKCSATGNPAPEITWIKYGKTVGLGETLRLTSVDRNQSGEYVCSVDNVLGFNMVTSAKLDVQFSPSVVEVPTNKTIFEGETATFHCKATGNPAPEITWTKNGKTVGSGETLSFETSRNQSGKYLCSADNGIDKSASASAYLDVHYPLSLTTTPSDQTVREGETAEFHCSATGNPPPKVIWMKDGKVVGQGDKLSFESSKNRSGKYWCMARNELGLTINASALLDVQFSPVIDTEPVSKTVTEGTMVKFFCNATGNPLPEITWIRNGETVAQGETMSFETIRDQSGEYWCLVENGMSPNASASANLDVQFPPSFTSKPVDQTVKEGDETTLHCTATGNPTPNITWIKDGMAVAFGETFKFSANRTKSGTYWCSVENGLNVAVNTSASLDVQFPPSCVVTPKSHSVIEGHDASFLCSATGNPTPDLTWYKDGMVVASGDTLTFTANRNQSGQYWCSAENIFNKTVRASGNLEVHFKPEKTRLTVTPDVSDRVKFGSSVKFTCTAESRPTVEVYNFYRDQLLLGSNISGIYEVQLQRSGRYSCVPVNRAGNGTQSSINIAVDVQKPYFPELVPPVYLFKDSQARLPCKPAGEPQPTVKWFKDGVAISYGQNANYRLQANGTLIIDKVENGNAGKYTCMAENFLGKANVTARGILLERTKIFRGPPQTQTVSQGTNVELKCNATADPSLELRYIWKKDGIEVISSKPENVLRILNISVDEAGIYTCVAFTPEPKRSEDSVSAIVSIIGVPPPPENLQITDCYDRAPILSWTPVASNNAPITQYLIYQESNHNPTVFKLHNVTDPNVTSFQLSLPGWTNLRFRVRAVNDFGAGRPSLSTAKGACETPSVAPKSHPKNLRGVPGNANELVIYWDPMPKDEWNAQGFYYVIQYRRVNGRISEWRDEKIADPGVNMFDLSNPGYYQLWEFTIRAGNNEGSGPASPVKKAHSGQNAPVVKPESSEVGTVSDDSVTLSWEPVTVKRGSVDGYRIYYWGEPLSVSSRRKRRAIPSTAEKFEVIGGSNTQATITGLKPFSAYSAAVKAFNSGGEGPESPIINFETSESEPGPPSDVFIDAFDEFLRIRWTPPQEPNGIINGYRVGWAEYDGSSPERVVLSMEEVEVTVRTMLLKNKKSETSYVVEVQAKTSKGWGRGLRRNTTTVKKSAPAKPLKPTVKQIPGKNAFNVTYNFAVGGGWTLEFKVFYRKEAAEGETYQNTAWVDHFERRWTVIDDLKPDKYEFKTVARNKVGMSTESDLTFADLENAEKVQDVAEVKSPSTYNSDWFITVVIIGAIVVLLIVIVVVVKQCRKRRSENLHESDKEKEASQENPKPIDFKPREDWRTRLERVDEADSESHDSLDEYGGGGAYFSEDGSFVGEFDAKKSDTPREQVQDPAV